MSIFEQQSFWYVSSRSTTPSGSSFVSSPSFSFKLFLNNETPVHAFLFNMFRHLQLQAEIAAAEKNSGPPTITLEWKGALSSHPAGMSDEIQQQPPLSLSVVVQHLQALLSVPVALNYPSSLSYAPANDTSTLSCGCLVSEGLFKTLRSEQRKSSDEVSPDKITCPLCETNNVGVIAPCTNMRNLVTYFTKLKQELSNGESAETSFSHHFTSNSSFLKEVDFLQREKSDNKELNDDLPSMFSKLNTETPKRGQIQSTTPVTQSNLSFLTAFHEVLVEIQNPSSVESNEISKSPSYSGKYSPQDHYLEDSMHSSGVNINSFHNQSTGNIKSHSPTSTSAISSLGSIQRQRTRQSSFQSTSNLTKLMSSNSTSSGNQHKPYSNKEILLSKNFPFFRRAYTFNIHNSNFLLKTKSYLQTQLSPNLTKLALLSEKKWEIYKIDTERPDRQPKLFCCGKSDGSYGPDPDHMKRVSKDQIITNSNITENVNETMNLLENWEHLYCQITENLLIISGTRGFLRVIDLTQSGRCLYTYQCNFPIRCLDVSMNEGFIALGITGKDKYTQVEQAVIIIIKLIPETARSPFQILTYPFSLPYRDPINLLKFSSDSTLLSVATALESRFLVISLVDPSRPTLVMKSQRRLDTSLDSEGITDISFFPDNRLMTITSLSHNSEPIIIDTNISSIFGPDGIAKPKLLMKIDEVGSTIHKCCVSPRGDSVAYINRNGNVYIMTTPRMDDNDNKKIACVLEVSNAFRAKEAASVRFDSDGYKLYVLDRKGILSIADFTAGTVEDHTVTRCKIIT